ncbi:hypothetical protein VTK73DRAFT_5824 [Phialemonium thermophilum]|uniref:Uncharacterized protein n=1 Tax=Phialemonium thermophilum TaxID=223376 RepID=A0ABR3V0F8_9PEZI
MKLERVTHVVARDEFDDGYVPFWYTRTGIIVKWSLFLGLITLFCLYLFLGYMHAKSRIRKGLPPLAYHRWLVSRAELARVDPRYAYPQPAGYSTYRPYPEQYGMYAMPPPPVYDPNEPRPPMYDGRMPETKAGPAPPNAAAAAAAAAPPPPPPAAAAATAPQQPSGVSGDYAPPPGPPPSALRPQSTGNSNPFRD